MVWFGVRESGWRWIFWRYEIIIFLFIGRWSLKRIYFLRQEEENCLSGISWMNNFSASIVLCEMSLQEFVEMSPEDRMDGFGGYIGVQPMVGFC